MKFDMVFKGGGAKGMVFVGAMQEFESRGHYRWRSVVEFPHRVVHL